MAPAARSGRKSQPKVRSFYADSLLNVPTRLGLSKNTLALLTAHDEVKLGMIEEVDIGRKVRLSLALRQSLVDTITQCTETMRNTPSEVANCIQIIQKCAEMLKIADRPQNAQQFPFFKLPLEIRTRIYDLSFGKHGCSFHQISLRSDGSPKNCPSNPMCPPLGEDWDRPISLATIQTCSRVYDEALPVFYKHRSFSFSCCCSMFRCLTNNVVVRKNVRQIQFYWRGPQSDVGISSLKYCPELKNLIVRISRTTTYHATIREAEMRQFFQSQKTSLRLCDAKGIEEFMQIRGLKSVTVKHAPVRVANKRTDEDLWAMQLLLKSKVLAKKPEGYGQT